jgi:DNA-binding CsgD family transcriptional regulator
MTQAELIEFIRTRSDGTDGFTVGQIAERLDASPKTVRAILTPMMKRGDLMAVMVTITDAWGRRFKVPGYRVKA